MRVVVLAFLVVGCGRFAFDYGSATDASDGPTGPDGAGLACGDGLADRDEACGEPGLSCQTGLTCLACSCQGTALAVGKWHGCVRRESGQMKCWGWNFHGHLGLGDTNTRGNEPGEMGANLAPVDLGANARAIGASRMNTCAILENGDTKCWGANGGGQLGVGDTVSRGGLPGQIAILPGIDFGVGRYARGIAVGREHMCALLDDRSIACLGANGSGSLGLGHTAARGDTDDELGVGLARVDVGASDDVVAVGANGPEAGGGTSCALLASGVLKCWGHNVFGQLGLGDTNNRGDAPGEMGDSLPVIDLAGAVVRAIAVGETHVCALAEPGAVYCWGANGSGQLGQGDVNHRGDQPGEMGIALPPVDLGVGRRAVAIAAGGAHSCAVLDDRSVKCWGANGAGQLGLGDTNARGDGPGEMGDSLPAIDFGGGAVTNVAAGGRHTCVALGPRVKCWGQATEGQLGQGNDVALGDNAGEMGSALPDVDLGP